MIFGVDGLNPSGVLLRTAVLPPIRSHDGGPGGEGKPMTRTFLAFGMLPALSAGGRTFAAQVNGSGDARGGAVSHATTFTQAGVLSMANAWCGHLSLVTQEIRVAFIIDGMDFACIPPPA